MGLDHQHCHCPCNLGGPYAGSALPPMASWQTNAGRHPLCGLVLHPVALGAPAALSLGGGECSPCLMNSPSLHLPL